jgi:pimeloyl-ACP methyl ester carboxylesterase
MVAFDLPGHGGSANQDDYRIDAVSAAVHNAVSAGAFPTPVVVGHSVSGLIATFYAARYPTRGVVNVDQPLELAPFAELVRSLEDRLRGPDFSELWGMFEASFHTELLPREAQTLVRSTTHVDRELVLGYWSQIFERSAVELGALVDEAAAAVRERHLPYVYVSGSAVEASYLQWLTARLPQVEVVQWPNSGHFPHLAHPDAFVELLAATAAW